jgi:hypothetical protein
MDVLTEQQWEGEILYLPAPSGKSAMIGRVREYWRARCGVSKLPRRADIDPLDLRDVLPYLSVMEYADPPFRLKFRLIGTELARFYGCDVSGKWIDEIAEWAPEDIVDTVAVFRRVYDLGVPVYGLSLCTWENNPDHIFEFACFPLSDDGRNITHCLSIDDYTMVAARSGRRL